MFVLEELSKEIIFDAAGDYGNHNELQKIIDGVKSGKYVKPVYLKISGIRVPVQKNSTPDSLLEDFDTKCQEKIMLERKDKELQLASKAKWERENPNKCKEIYKQNEKDEKLISSVYFDSVEGFFQELRAIPKGLDLKTTYLAIVVACMRMRNCSIKRDEKEVFNEKVVEILEGLGTSKHNYGSEEYGELSKQNNNKFAISIVNNLFDNAYMGIAGLRDRVWELAMDWIKLRTSKKLEKLDKQDPRPDMCEKIVYESAFGTQKSVTVGEYKHLYLDLLDALVLKSAGDFIHTLTDNTNQLV